jgi:integrase
MSRRDGLYKRGPYFWITRDPVTKKPISTRCRDREAARGVLRDRERLASDPARMAERLMPLDSECRRFLDARTELGKATDFYELKLGHWCRLLGDELPIGQVGPEAFDLFVSQRRGEGASDHTISKEVGCMLRVLRLSKRSGVYAGELAVLRPMGLSAGYVPRTRVLSSHELASLLRQLPEQRHGFVALCVGLGLRRGEAFALQPEHIDLVTGVVHVPGTKTAGARRTIPILAPFRQLVERAARSLPLEPWGNYLRDLRAACERAGIPPLSANDLRRTHATLLGQAGVDRDVVRRLLGHSVSSTMLETVYDKPKPLELAARAGDLTGVLLELSGDRPEAELFCRTANANAPCVPKGFECAEHANQTAPRALP